MENIEKIARSYEKLQKEICNHLELTDGKGKFSIKSWTKNIGEGITAVLQKGAAIEKGAVNFSFVKGKFTPAMEKLLGEKANNYMATGISSILHPSNPWVPIIHMNVRYFALDNGVSWFGGGIDLTPHIIVPADAKMFHQSLKTICDNSNSQFYTDFKKRADDYFYLPHRNETRGVGGIFFDRIKPNETINFETLFDFTVNLSRTYPVLYSEYINKYRSKAFTEREKNWQNLRRGRYVEFNLVYDRGTKFGLESGGNTESILVSLPANASWEYNYIPKANGFEEKTTDLLKKDIDWINFAEKN